MKQVSTQRVNSPGTSQHEDMEMGALHKTIRGEIQTHISGEAQLNAEISHKKNSHEPGHACVQNELLCKQSFLLQVSFSGGYAAREAKFERSGGFRRGNDASNLQLCSEQHCCF